MSSLIVFFSRKDENYVGGILKNLEIGNTCRVAGIIKGLTESQIFEIEMIEPYSKHYNECIAEAQRDQQGNARPRLVSYPKSISEYDVIYLGFPNYWGTMPMAVFTFFLEHFDFTGKTIRPFCTHEGSGFGSSKNDIQKTCPTAKVAQGLAIHGSRIDRAEIEIKKWLEVIR